MLCDLFSWNTASSKVLNSFIRWRLWQSFTHCVPCVPLALPFAAPVNNYTMTVFHAHCFGGCRMPYRPCTLEWPAWKCKPHPYPHSASPVPVPSRVQFSPHPTILFPTPIPFPALFALLSLIPVHQLLFWADNLCALNLPNLYFQATVFCEVKSPNRTLVQG